MKIIYSIFMQFFLPVFPFIFSLLKCVPERFEKQQINWAWPNNYYIIGI